MLTQENEYYIRLILLLLRGGTLVLKQVFLKKLEDQGSQLNAFLQINKEAIKTLKEGKVLTLKQYNILYPVNGSVTEICEWDISLLACVLLNFFVQSFQKSEEKAIENIRTFRNDFAGHHPDGCIDARTFFRKWNQLSNFITNLGNGLSSSERSDLAELIKCVGDDPIEIRRAIQDIKDATGTKDQFMEHVSQLLEHLSHTVEQLNSRQDEMSKVLQDSQTDIKELKNSNRNVSTIIIGEVTLSSENPEAVIAAANTLIDNTKRSIGLLKRLSTVLHGGREGLTNTVFTFFARVKGYLWEIATIPETANEDSLSQKSVTALVQDIHKAGGEVIDATEGSVLLHIQCHSVNELLDVLNYFKSSDIDQRLDFIAECLTEELGCRISLSACIQVESLQEAFHLIQEKQNPVFTKRVLLSIKCEKSEGVLNVVKLFEDGDASNKLSTISNDLSDELGSPVVLRASLDTDTLHEYVHATKGNQFEQGETQQSVMRYEPLVEIKAHDSLSKESTEKETSDKMTNERKQRIKKLRADQLAKKSATDCQETSYKTQGKAYAFGILNNEMGPIPKQSFSKAPSRDGPVSKTLLVFATASVVLCIMFIGSGLFVVFKPEDSSIMTQLEKVQDRLVRHETQIKDLKFMLEESNGIISHLVKEFAQLKAVIRFITQSLMRQRLISKRRRES